MNSIFQRTNPAIEKMFAEAGKPEKVMCIPIDYAKRQHTALVCNGAGEQLRSPFNIHNTLEGVAFLDKIIRGLCRKHHIRRQHVFFGGEDCGSYCFNFIHELLQQGFLGIGMNAQEAVEQRENMVASTDKLDLLGIAAVLVRKKHGRTLSLVFNDAKILRELTHHRDALIKARTASALRIHHIVDQLMPGFLDETKSGITPFTRASLWLMSQNFSPKQICSRKNNVLADKLRFLMVRNVDEKVQRLKELARSVLPPPDALCEILQSNLLHETSIYTHLTDCLGNIDKNIARRLALTPGAMLTTVQGIGITLAAGLYAEIGDPDRSRNMKCLTAYAGIVTRLKQSGGPDKKAVPKGRSRRGCVPLKRRIMDIALKIGQYGHEELRADYQRRVADNQDPRLTMGRRMLRICAHLIRHTDFFLPPSILKEPDNAVRRDYYQKVWGNILLKWSNAGAMQQAFSAGAPLEQWRNTLNELYSLNLKKTSPQYDPLFHRQ